MKIELVLSLYVPFSKVIIYTNFDQEIIDLKAKKNSYPWPLQAGSTVVKFPGSPAKASNLVMYYVTRALHWLRDSASRI